MKIDSLMVLACPWSSLPMILKLLSVMLCSCFLYVFMDWRELFKVFLASFSKGPCCFPYVLLIASYMFALETVHDATFLLLWVLVLGIHKDLSDDFVAFEVYLYTILTTDVFENFLLVLLYMVPLLVPL